LTSLADMELRRDRWRRVRAACHLTDPADADFGRGGLARSLDEVSVRLLVLPSDPEVRVRVIDEEALSRLENAVQEWGRPHGVSALWGHTKTACAEGAMIFAYDQSRRGPWTQYLCQRADGGLEAGIGSAGARTYEDRRYFFLRHIVVRLWSALAVLSTRQDAEVEGPLEISLALCGTEKSLLADFAEGWAEPGSAMHEPTACAEPNVLFRVEVGALPAPDDIEELAFGLGALIENAYGYTLRRFIAKRGSFEGQFDWRGVD
jgi:hypothetical protein